MGRHLVRDHERDRERYRVRESVEGRVAVDWESWAIAVAKVHPYSSIVESKTVVIA